MVRLVTDEPMTVETSDGKMITGKAREAASGQDQAGRAARLCPLSQVAAINPEDLEPFKLDGQSQPGGGHKPGQHQQDDRGHHGPGGDHLGRPSTGLSAGLKSTAPKARARTPPTTLWAMWNTTALSATRWYWLANLQGITRHLQEHRVPEAWSARAWAIRSGSSKLTNLSFELGPNYVYQEDTAGVS